MRIKTFIVCDDIRFEENNKHSLIGIYKDRIIFIGSKSSKQNLWPKLFRIAFYILVETNCDKPKKFSFTVKNGGNEFSAEGNLVVERNHTAIPITFNHFPFFEGSMEFSLNILDEKGELLESLNPDINFTVTEDFR